ncbi:uncharacterized protein [Panulirus ornatus]|uniref:uncharacterized protein isoform X1 n=1 Tax=Panulirus ornatus TaxID=150431 RepID=UPI003A8BA125
MMHIWPRYERTQRLTEATNEREAVTSKTYDNQVIITTSFFFMIMASAASMRKRNSNWTEDETVFLMNLIKQHEKIVRGRFSDGVTSRTNVAEHYTADKCSLPLRVKNCRACSEEVSQHNILRQELDCYSEKTSVKQDMYHYGTSSSSSQESLPTGSTLIHRPTSVDWGQPVTEKVTDLEIKEL